MKLCSPLMLVTLLSFASASMAETTTAANCTPEELLKKAEETAITINTIAGGDAAKAERLHTQLMELQQRSPAPTEIGACAVYEHIIQELKKNAA